MDTDDDFGVLDYTDSTDWEKFISSIEAVIQQWRVDNLERPDCARKHDDSAACYHASLVYRDHLLNASYFCNLNTAYKPGTICAGHEGDTHDFPPTVANILRETTSEELLEPLELSLRFAIDEYIVVRPVDWNTEEFEIEKHAILSAFAVAASNDDWQIPIMLAYPVDASSVYGSEPIYVGFCRNSSFHTRFETARLPLGSLDCRYLSDWIDLFRTAVSTLEATPEAVTVSVSRTYERVGHSSRPLLMQNIFYWCVSGCGEAVESFKKLTPSCVDFPCSFELMILWPNRSEEMLLDTASYSDLDPLATPHWYLQLTSASFELESSPLAKLILLIGSSTPIRDCVDPSVRDFSGMDSEVYSLIDYIFDENQPSELPVENMTWCASFERIQKMITDYRSTKCGLLCERIGIAVSRLLVDCSSRFYHTNVKKALAFLWDKLLYHLRSRWLDGTLLDAKHVGLPKVASCSLQQNIEMLNFGIAQKSADNFHGLDETFACVADSSFEEEFFDCDEPAVCSKEADLPEGRFAKAEGMFQLENENEALYIPVYQETTPLMVDLGRERPFGERLHDVSPEEIAQSKRYSRAVLFSDMQAFKAANPGCCFQDFLRLHSPKDVVQSIDETTGKRTYCLSPRMSAEENMWRSMWEKAHPVAAACQRPIVHYVRRPEKVFDWLENLTVGEIVYMSLTYAFAMVIEQLLPTLNPTLRNCLKEEMAFICSGFALCLQEKSENHFQELHEALLKLETKVHMYETVALTLKSHCENFANDEVEKFAYQLVSSKRERIPGGAASPIGQVVDHLFSIRTASACSDQQNDGTNDCALINERYILRWFAANPSPSSRRSPQRMCVELRHRDGYFVSTASLTEDTDFFLE